MKSCPRCDKTYPDSETFCEVDGTALTHADPAFAQAHADATPAAGAGDQSSSDTPKECPVCGGQTEPGEIICNFCGARLTNEPMPAPSPAPTRFTPQSPSRPAPSVQMTSQMPQTDYEEESSGGGMLVTLGYILAAVIALGGGVWFALHLSSGQSGPPAPAASSSPAAPTGPIVALASTMPIQVTGESSSAPERNQDAARKVFDSNHNALTETYMHAVAGESTLHDGMIVRLRVLPDGSVAGAAIRTSTATNPGLDAEVVNAVSAWKFPAFAGSQVEVDYPVIFASDGSQQSSIESDLSGKLAALSPAEAAEFASAAEASAEASAPSPAAATTPASPTEASAPAASSEPTSAVASAETPAPAVPRPARKRLRRREMAALPKPTPALLDRVQDALRSVRKLGRVRAYTNHGTVVLFGKVYDDNDKALADRVVRDVPGVTGVNNTITTDLAEWSDTAARITAQLQSAGLSKVTVRVIGRDAYLNGEVKTALERDRAATVTEGAAAVTVKANMIRVVPGGIFSF